MNWTRRDFIATGTLAAAAVPFLGACKKKEETVANDKPAAEPVIILPSQITLKPSYFERNFGVTPEMIDKVLAKTMSRGGSFGDLFFEHSKAGSVNMLDGKVNSASASSALGMGARCVNEDQVGYAYCETLTLEDMLKAADAASAIAPGAAPIEIKSRHEADLKRYYGQNIDWDALDVARAVALIQKVDALARSKDASIIQVTVGLSWHQRVVMINTSDGIHAEDSQPYFTLRLSVVMKRNDEIQSNGSSLAGKNDFESITDERIQALVDHVISSTDILFSAVKPKGGEWPVVLGAGASGILLHEAIGHGLEADFNRKDRSIFATKLNQKVSSDEVTICDSGLFDNSRGALNVDDEGNACQDTVLVENGILKSYLHDRISAAHYKVASTGSGRREDYKNYPVPRMRVTYMKNGTHEKEELFADIKYGIYCTNFTNGQVLIGPGDYTFYVKNGFLIEDGKFTAPIKDVNIIGNGPDTLSKITKVANDFELSNVGWTCGKDGQSVPVSLGMPSALVSAITVGGV